MNERASITALLSAFGRAYHTEKADAPIFKDTVAKRLLRDGEYQRIADHILGGMDFFAPEKKGTFATEDDALDYLVHTQIAPTPIARARFCEDSLKTAIRTGTEQYVILGAGLDTFAFRENGFMKRHAVFEVDHPLTQADKLERIARAGLEFPQNLHCVPVDLATDSLCEKLTDVGFDRTKKTFFSWLGVSCYLSEAQTDAMLGSLAALSAEGSTLVFDYADEGLFSSDVKRVQNMLAMAAAGGEPMRSCFDYAALEALLEKHRFLIYEWLTAEDIQARYFAGQPAFVTAFEHINYVAAVFK